MAKDDYFVIVYKILAYLYQQLKKGEKIDRNKISYDSKYCNINKEYWIYIMENMQGEGLIKGFKKGSAKNGDNYIEEQLEKIQITPKGIDFLEDKSISDRVSDLTKGIAKSIPGL